MSTPSPPPAGRATVLRALLDLVATDGLERASVRHVATAAGVAIGTVQHYFPTKDAMLVAAFEEVVSGIRRRVADLPLDAGPRANLERVLHELLPLDERREREVRVQLAFAARAATVPELADIQRAVLSDVREALAEGFAATARPADLAAGALALVDGLAQHAVSSGATRLRDARAQRRVVAAYLDAVVGT